jgi:hypothetical protein
MLAQIRAVLERYRANGGAYTERVFEDCGHSPLIEKADEFRALLREFLAANPVTARAQGTSAPGAPASGAAEQSQSGRGGLFWFLRRRGR